MDVPTDHDLLIRIDERVEAIYSRLEKGDHRMDTLDGRLTYLEQNGAKISQESAKRIVELDDRLKLVEEDCIKDEAVCETDKKWYNSLWAKGIGVTAIAITIYEFLQKLRTGQF